MFKPDSGALLRLNALVRSNRLKFAGVLAADALGLRYTVVRLDPALVCNLRCAMCYFSDPKWYAQSAGPRFTPEQMERVADVFFPEALQVYIGCGAEPTMWKGYPEIVRLAKQRGAPFVGLVTNGQLLSADGIDALAAYGLDEVIVSVHGVDGETYQRLMRGASWERLHENLRLLAAARRNSGGGKLALRLNYTVNNDNVDGLGDLLTVFGDYAPTTIQIRPISDLGDTAYTDKDLSRSLKAYEAGLERLRIACDAAGVSLLANTRDPLHRDDNRRAVVYEHAVLRYVSPRRVWRDGFDPAIESYAALKRRIGFRRSLLRWATLGSAELERASALSSSDIL